MNMKYFEELEFDIDNFKSKIGEQGRVVSIDFGTKKIGIAMTDDKRIIATPFQIYQRKNFENDINFFINLIDEYKIQGIVIGVALIDGEFLGNKRLFFMIRQFVNRITEIKKIPYLFYDEEFSSHMSNEELYEFGLNKNQIARQEDKIVAANFLKDVFGC